MQLYIYKCEFPDAASAVSTNLKYLLDMPLNQKSNGSYISVIWNGVEEMLKKQKERHPNLGESTCIIMSGKE